MNSTGLVLEGGGMRGVYTAGVLEYFMEKDLYIPYVIGVSAGACIAASYLSRQKGRNRTVNIDYARDPQYLSFQNFIKKRQLFGMDFIFDQIPNKLVPFDFTAFMQSPETFLVGTTDCYTGKPMYFDKETYGSDILTILRASSSLPFISPVVPYQNKQLLDGGITDSIPIKKSIDDGNSKNVLILTRNAGYIKKKPRMDWLMRRTFRQFPNLVSAILNRYSMYNDTMAFIEEQEKAGKAFVIRPAEPLEMDRIERNPAKLEKLYEQGKRDAEKTYGSLVTWLNAQ
ncbi:patatin family protein [Metabacillus sp. GX 13764]|uniref:patatin-like phospholipase family protein n=1 Tax=Metabacillus kandeliae TaxID=2900151 RepID=UPI001E501D95|nr:patatin family protein [Metabacillus kandeliae]MCD7036136.1 patatin family protein [Metabacillus kandeliae]